MKDNNDKMNDSDQETTEERNSSSLFSLLVEAAESREEGEGDKSTKGPHPVELPPQRIEVVAPEPSSATRSLLGESAAGTTIDTTTRDKNNEGKDGGKAAETEDTCATLSVMASAASKKGDLQNAEDAKAEEAAQRPDKQPSTSTNEGVESKETEQNKEKTSTEKKRTGSRRLIETVKSLSKDPLVQLSMLRAMRQQRAQPSEVEKNKLERDKAHAQQEADKKKRASAKKPSKADAKGRKRSSEKKTRQKRTTTKTKRNSKSGVEAVRIARPDVNAEQDTRCYTTQNSLPQPNLQELQQGQQAPNIAAMVVLQTLLQQQQQAQQIGQVHQQGQITPEALSLLQSVFSNLNGIQEVQGQINPLQQNPQGAYNPVNDQVLQGSSGQDLGMNPNGPTERSITGNGRQVVFSTNEVQATTLDSKTEARIPCRARGMPPDHNFQVRF